MYTLSGSSGAQVFDKYRIFDVARRGPRARANNRIEFISVHTNPVIVVPVTVAGSLVLIRQYREPLRRETIGLPAGRKDVMPSGRVEAPQRAALRELLEETGYTAPRAVCRPSGYSSPGLTNQIVDFTVASMASPGNYRNPGGEHISATIEASILESLRLIERGEVAGVSAQNAIRDYAIMQLRRSAGAGRAVRPGAQQRVSNDWSSSMESPRQVGTGRIFRYSGFSVRVERWMINSMPKERDIVESPNIVAPLAATESGRLLLIKVHRPAVGADLWELPSTQVGRRAGAASCASAALGCLSNVAGQLGLGVVGKPKAWPASYSMNGMATEMVHNFYIKISSSSHAPRRDLACPATMLVGWDTALWMIEHGRIVDQKTQNAIRAFGLKRLLAPSN